MSELKPCPFCDGEAQIDRMGTNKVSMQISCGYCGAHMETGETWIDENSHWNQRATEDALTETLRLKEEECKQLAQDVELLLTLRTSTMINPSQEKRLLELMEARK